jgi:DeoR/GlpR family transcriptional regulator of sugar metabolism
MSTHDRSGSGEQSVEALKKLHASRLVMSTGGITADGLFNSNALLVETERQMIRAADRVTLVADSSKFGQRALSHLCPLSDVDEIVTDDGMSEEWRHVVESAGLKTEGCQNISFQDIGFSVHPNIRPTLLNEKIWVLKTGVEQQ